MVSGPGVVSTPYIIKGPIAHYFLTLEAASVGNQRIAADGSFGTTEGNIFIDSGAALTYLPQAFNSKLVSAVSSFVNTTPVAEPNGLLDACYNYTPNFKFPVITIHFRDADVKLEPGNTFIGFSRDQRKIACLTFKGIEGAGAIFGNWMQTNFLVGYDTEKRTVSFKPTDCTQK